MSGVWLNMRKTWSHETRPVEDEKQREAQNAWLFGWFDSFYLFGFSGKSGFARSSNQTTKQTR
jgi:hypothetical protein